MKTKYDVGQVVLLKVKVAGITVDKSGIVYSIIMSGRKNPIHVPEKDIECASEENNGD